MHPEESIPQSDPDWGMSENDYTVKTTQVRVGGFVSDLLYGIEGDVVHSGAGASDVESLEMLAYMVNRERFVVHYKRTDAQAAVVAKARMEIK